MPPVAFCVSPVALAEALAEELAEAQGDQWTGADERSATEKSIVSTIIVHTIDFSARSK